MIFRKNKVIIALTTSMCISAAMCVFSATEAIAGSGDYAVNLEPTKTIESTDVVVDLNDKEQFTIELKLKVNSHASNTWVISKQLGATNRIQLQLTDGKIVAVVANSAQGGNAWRRTLNAEIDTSKWYHVAMVFDGTAADNDRLKVYVNGSSVALVGSTSLPNKTAVNSEKLIIGSNKFDGSIDELRVWDTALSEDVISLWQHSALGTQHPNHAATPEPSNLKLYWPFNDATEISEVTGGENTSYSGQSTSPLDYQMNKVFSVYGFAPYYRVNSIIPEAYDHLSEVVYKSVKPLNDGSLSKYLNGNSSKAEVAVTLNQLKSKVGNRPVKILVGVGGGEASGDGEYFNKLTNNNDQRTRFAKHLKNFCHENGVDGIDINWEFPHTVLERKKWLKMLEALHAELNNDVDPDKDIMLTASFRATDEHTTISEAETSDLALQSQDYLDLLTLQLYNRRDSAWNHTPYSNFVNLTTDYTEDTSYLNEQTSTTHTATIDKSKFLSGTPFYARGKSSATWRTTLTYRSIVEKTGNAAYVDDIVDASDDDVENMDSTKIPLGSYSFNGVNSQIKKGNYIRDNGLQGLMLWEVGHDVDVTNDKSLLKVIHQVLPTNQTPVAPTPGFEDDIELADHATLTVGRVDPVTGVLVTYKVKTPNNEAIAPMTSVQFTDKSSREPTSWSWSFPGGSPSTSTDQNPVVIYTDSGSHDVTLTVTNSNGTRTLTRENLIHVN
ncbi:MAG: PKD domain-containing protein [Colwellia sp.]|nr:PKD domain-containing protein [Colwellia sp.]